MNDLHFRRGTYKYKDQFDTDLIRLIEIQNFNNKIILIWKTKI